MLRHLNIPVKKKALIFGLDDVLFPREDYLLQVYYLFANLLEYTETVPPAKDLTEFLKSAYMQHGESGLFERAAEVFGIDTKYRTHFDRLHLTAKLPLKLLLYQSVKDTMQAAHEDGKQLFILTGGNPALQLNKLRHIEWEGLDQVVKVYFEKELVDQQKEPIPYLLAENGLEIGDILYIRASKQDVPSMVADVDSLEVNKRIAEINDQ